MYIIVFVLIPVAAELVLRKFRGIPWRHQLQHCDVTSRFHSTPKVFLGDDKIITNSC